MTEFSINLCFHCYSRGCYYTSFERVQNLWIKTKEIKEEAETSDNICDNDKTQFLKLIFSDFFFFFCSVRSRPPVFSLNMLHEGIIYAVWNAVSLYIKNRKLPDKIAQQPSGGQRVEEKKKIFVHC